LKQHGIPERRLQSAYSQLKKGRCSSSGWLLLLVFFPLLADAGEALRVAVISDLNGDYGSTDYEAEVDEAVSSICALNPDLVISTGDMVAGQRRPHAPPSGRAPVLPSATVNPLL
jgi:hypothetical protein